MAPDLFESSFPSVMPSVSRTKSEIISSGKESWTTISETLSTRERGALSLD